MLNSLANYLLRGNASGTQESRDVTTVEYVDTFPLEARLRQVEVEGNDWILIDQTVEGITSMAESWYVTPPACFTRASPVHVETSPLEDLLIEHPSMSVYRAAAPPNLPDGLPPTSDSSEGIGRTVVSVPVLKAPSSYSSKQHRRQRRNMSKIVETPRKPSIRDYKVAHSDKNVEILQLRSAQKIRDLRVSKTSKRNWLEQGNKVREYSSAKGRRPRRQDRLRFKYSGVNNDRRC